MTTKIIGTGSFTPENIIMNNDLAKIVDTSDEWISSRTGIRERRIATDTSTAIMAANAALEAIKDSNVNPEDIDLIVVATTSADHSFPSCACEVQSAIGAVNAAAFDVSAACSGFVFAMSTMHAYLKAGIYKTGLVIGVDMLSKMLDWSDRSTCVLFGDGAGAVVVRAEDTGIISVKLGSDGTKKQVLTCKSRGIDNFITKTISEPTYISMDGQEVFKFAVKKVPECINELLLESGMSPEDIKYYILHQANKRIIDSVAKRLKLPIESFPINMDRYGNTSAATIPLLLDELNKAKKLNKGDKLIFSGFGAGLTWGALLIEW